MSMVDYPVSHPPENRCSQCGKDIELHIHLDEDTDKEAYRLINGGGRFELAFGYGSCHDLRNFVMYICDECVPSFIDSRKTKVGEFCCMGYGQDKALTPNVIVDEQFPADHHARLVAQGWKPVTADELLEVLGEPVDQPPTLSAFETYWRLNEELGNIRSRRGDQESWQEAVHVKKMEAAWEALIKTSSPQVYENWKLARSKAHGTLPECTNMNPDGNGL